MIHIFRTDNRRFKVQTRSSTAVDHELLSSTTTQGFERIAGAWTNIRAQMLEWGTESVLVQDNTGKKPQVYRVTPDGALSQKNASPEIIKKAKLDLEKIDMEPEEVKIAKQKKT